MKIKFVLIILFTLFLLSLSYPKKSSAFRFVAWADTKSGTATLKSESLQVSALNPVFTIFPGDVCDSGPTATCFTTWQNAFNGGSTPGNGLFNKTFATRGNHDSAGTTFWIANFNVAGVASSIGAANVSQLNTNLTYSFDYQNSHFVGIDLPSGGISSMSSAQITWLDNDLKAAEARGLTHAFLFWHGPVYPVDGHCCESNATLNTMLDKHKILSATFHGHEHVVAYVHIDSSRYPTITHPYEEIISGDAGAGPSSATSGRYDWWIGSKHGFTSIDVNGTSYTVNFYELGNTTPVKSYTFSNNPNGPTGSPAPTRSPSPLPTKSPSPSPIISPSPTPTKSPSPTPTKTPISTATPNQSPTPSPTSKIGDINGDGSVNIIDIGIVVDNYGKFPIPNVAADVNKDGSVDIIDIGIIIDNYGK